MRRKGKDLSWAKWVSKYLQYLHPETTLWICTLTFDVIIPKKLYSLDLFCDFDFSFFLPKIHVFAVHYAVMLPCSVHCYWIKPRKTPYEKCRYVLNSLA